MKHILLNLKSFFKNEKLLFFIMVICVVISAFIVNFSYGLYYNYDTQKNEAQIELTSVPITIADGQTLTNGEFKNYIESLKPSTLADINLILARSVLSEYVTTPPSYGTMDIRFVIENGEYMGYDFIRENWDKNGLIKWGHYITDEEERNGELVAMIRGSEIIAPNSITAELKNPDGTVSTFEISKETENIMNDNGTITLFGKEYTIVGVYEGPSGVPIVPFLSVPDDHVLDGVAFGFEQFITRNAYNDLVETADRMLAGKLVFPELDLPDEDTVAIYNNMITISFIISVLSLVNFAMLYHFVISKRKNQLAVMRICGCSKPRAVLTYLGECAIITIPSYIVGLILNILLVDNVFGNIFEHIKDAYAFDTYAVLFATYIVSFFVIMLVMILRSVDKTVIKGWRE